MERLNHENESARIKFNGLWAAGLIVNVLITVIGYAAYDGWITGVFLGCLILCIVGTVAALSGLEKIGDFLLLIGSIGFVPAGLIFIFGYRKAKDAVAEYRFLKDKERC